MKKWVFAVLVAVLIAGCRSPEPRKAPATISPARGMKESQEFRQIEISPERVYQGTLILVNKDHPVRPSSVQPDLVDLSEQEELRAVVVLLDNAARLSQRVAEDFAGMVRAAVDEGVNRFAVTSGYRDHDEQEALYQEMGTDYALPPGYSEHNTGLALDIGSTQGDMNHAPEGEWLRQHAWEYGFVQRYPEDKVAITGIEYEPWHYRYVGLPHSAIMQQKGMVLEEYWDYVEEQGSLSATVDGQVFELYYYSISDTTTIPVPSGRLYDISGNNRGGVLVTVFPE